ncbi:MAG: magnesium chelatase domain-containing protein, partial [Bacilli bacterium]|nr:magnesium chelatase domain-containing protein [Bacilli bacterium]
KVKIKDELIVYIISNYTLESGVRELERILDKLIRFIIINKVPFSKINEEFINDVLGSKLYEFKLRKSEVGLCNIIGVTPLGGQIINVSSIFIPDDSIVVTGNIGEALKDNIKMIISYFKNTNYLDNKNIKNKGFHLHFDSNYLLDGYSGSLGIATSILSLILNKKIDNKTAFIGKLDLYGNIWAISSIKEKIISAYNNGIKKIYLPKECANKTLDIPKFIRDDISLVFVSKYDEVYKKLFGATKN